MPIQYTVNREEIEIHPTRLKVHRDIEFYVAMK